MALQVNTTGHNNTANGLQALSSNTTGSNNTATGLNALRANKTADDNTANGVSALGDNTTGGSNTASGFQALSSNTIGTNNTATGTNALYYNKTGDSNTADGVNALLGNTTGNNNIALGQNAGANLTTGSNNIVIGHFGAAGDAKTIRVGRQGTQVDTRIAGIRGTPIAGQQVVVNANGRWVAGGSSARFKKKIKPMEEASEAILRLEPVTFRYNDEVDSEGAPQFGLIAEEVAKIDPDLVERDEEGKVFSVRYDAVNAMLLNEFLKERRKVQQLETTVARQRDEQQRAIDDLTARLDFQAKQIERVTAPRKH